MSTFYVSHSDSVNVQFQKISNFGPHLFPIKAKRAKTQIRLPNPNKNAGSDQMIRTGYHKMTGDQIRWKC